MSTPGEWTVEILDAAVELMGRAGRGGTVNVVGTSMSPTLREGFVVAVEFAPQELRRGDMLLFRQREILVVHRLLGWARPSDGVDWLRTRGDATISLDPRLDPALVVGRVIAFRDEQGWWDVRSRGARLFALLMAWHGLVWSGLAALADRAKRAVGRPGRAVGPRTWLGRIDGQKQRLAHALIFRLLHRRTNSPVRVDDDATPLGTVH